MFFQALGSLSAAVLSHRIKSLTALVCALCLQLLALTLLVSTQSHSGYLIAVSLWGFSWNIGIANILGLMAKLPTRSRLLSLAPGTEAIGASLGPLLVALFLQPGDYTSVSLVAGVAVTASILFFVSIGRAGVRLSPQASEETSG